MNIELYLLEIFKKLLASLAIFANDLLRCFKDALSGLRHFLTTKCPLAMMKNTYSTLQARS